MAQFNFNPQPVRSQSAPVGPLLAMLARMAEERNARQIGASQSIGRGLGLAGQGVQQGLMQRNRLNEAAARRLQFGRQRELDRFAADRRQHAELEAAMARAKLPFQFNINSQGNDPIADTLRTMDNRQPPASPEPVPTAQGRPGRPPKVEATFDAFRGPQPERSPIIGHDEIDDAELPKRVHAALTSPPVSGIRRGPDGGFASDIAPSTPQEAFHQNVAAAALGLPNASDKQILAGVYATLREMPEVQQQIKEIEESGANKMRPTTLHVDPKTGAWVDHAQGNRIVRIADPEILPPMIPSAGASAYSNAAAQSSKQSAAIGKRMAMQDKQTDALRKKWGGNIRLLDPDGIQLVADLDEPIDPIKMIFSEKEGVAIIKAIRARNRK